MRASKENAAKCHAMIAGLAETIQSLELDRNEDVGIGEEYFRLAFVVEFLEAAQRKLPREASYPSVRASESDSC